MSCEFDNTLVFFLYVLKSMLDKPHFFSCSYKCYIDNSFPQFHPVRHAAAGASTFETVLGTLQEIAYFLEG